MSNSWIIPTAIAGGMAMIGVCVFVFSLLMKTNKSDGNPDNKVGARDAATRP